MDEMIIKRMDEEDEAVGKFIHNGFTRYGEQHGVTLNYDEFCFAAENADGRITCSLSLAVS